MKQYQKIIGIIVIGSIFSVFSPNLHFKGTVLFSGPDNAYAEDKNEKEDAAKASDKEGEEQPCPECPECPDPAKVVLRGLEEKKVNVEKAHKAMLQEKKELKSIEEQIDAKLEKLTALKKQIKDDMALLEKKKSKKELEKIAEYESRMQKLVKTYAAMKPKQAAAVVNSLELEVAQEIFLRMREANASQILSFVDSEKAAKISERLAFKKK